MSNILNINTALKPTYDEWNDSHQCVGFVKGTQIQGLGIPYGSFGNGKDVTKNLVKNYGYVDLKGNLKRGCVVSLGATSTNSYGHVVMINDMDSTYVWVAEGNYNGTSTGEYREAYKQTIADFKKRSGGIVGTAIHPKWNTTSSTPTPTSTPKEYVEAKRSGKDSYNGTFKFDMKYYEELKDLCNQKDIYDLDEEKWLAGTTWTSVKKVGSSSSSTPTYTKVKVTRSGKSTDNGTFYFPLSAWEDIKDLKLAKDTKDINGVTWKKDTTFNSATRV